MSDQGKDEGKGAEAKPEAAKADKKPPQAQVVGVNPERLKKEFPDLTEEDLEAYVTVTRRLLADPTKRVQVLEDVKAKAQAAQAKAGAGLSPDEALAGRYMQAIQKMQKRPPAKG
jgi:hypothetical protein